MKTIILYTIALPQDEEPIIEKHEMSEDEMGEYSDISENLEDAARSRLFEEVVLEYQSQFVNCFIVTPEELRLIKEYQD
jgi:hypothetical protein